MLQHFINICLHPGHFAAVILHIIPNHRQGLCKICLFLLLEGLRDRIIFFRLHVLLLSCAVLGSTSYRTFYSILKIILDFIFMVC